MNKLAWGYKQLQRCQINNEKRFFYSFSNNSRSSLNYCLKELLPLKGVKGSIIKRSFKLYLMPINSPGISMSMQTSSILISSPKLKPGLQVPSSRTQLWVWLNSVHVQLQQISITRSCRNWVIHPLSQIICQQPWVQDQLFTLNRHDFWLQLTQVKQDQSIREETSLRCLTLIRLQVFRGLLHLVKWILKNNREK